MARCKSCKRPIRYAIGPNGKLIPLDLTAPVYIVDGDKDGECRARRVTAYVTHFATCSDPNKHSKQNRRRGRQRRRESC